MFREINFLKLQNSDDIEFIYNKLITNLLKYNNSFFHYPKEKLDILVNDNSKLTEEDYFQFILKWENFNNHKHLLTHFFKSHTLHYPDIFKESERICIDEISISYEKILEEINVFKIKQLPIPYIYSQLISKLVKNIIISKVLKPFEKFILLNINLDNNNIELTYQNLQLNKEYFKTYKLTKFLLRYQKIYPNEYKQLKAWLIVSSNWKDIFFSSTFKQWTSCMNMINTYSDILVKYSNENYVKSRPD